MDVRTALELHRKGHIPEAEQAYRRIITIRPTDAYALHLLGMLCHQTGRHEEAITLLKRAIVSAPASANFRTNLAAVLGGLGRHAEAVEQARAAVSVQPDAPDAHHNLGVALELCGRWQESVAAYRRAIELRPDYADAHNHLGNALRRLGLLDEAVRSHQRAIGLRPDSAPAYNNLAATHVERGDQAQVIACRRRGVEVNSRSAAAHSDLLLALQYDATVDAPALLAEARRWEERHAQPLYRHIRPHAARPRTKRRLRVGYISPDFREHPVAHFIKPVLAHLDREQFEAYCYSDVRNADLETAAIRCVAGQWRDTASMSDEALAHQVRDDEIDILVDLCGHMGGNRLLVFARKPAPVQVTHFNYPNTTGLRSITASPTPIPIRPARKASTRKSSFGCRSAPGATIRARRRRLVRSRC
jgi:predicted O-linked N-acetylglucosamine transferase (SPINDLY family)